MGSANRGRFSDAGVDAMINTAMTTIDDTKRGLHARRGQRQGDRRAEGVVPVHYEVSAPGRMRKGLDYTARVDQYTFAHEVKPAKQAAH